MAYTTPPNLRLATTVSLPGLVNLTLNEGEQYKSTPSLRATPQDGNWYNFSLISLPSTRGNNAKTIPPRISYFVDGQLSSPANHTDAMNRGNKFTSKGSY